MELSNLVLALLVWIGSNSALDTNNVRLPVTKFVSMAKIHEVAGLHTGVAAVYDNTTKTVYIYHGFDQTNIEDQGYLMHELVHHAQFENRVPYSRCTKEYEREAQLLANRWFAQYGLPEPYSKTEIFFRSLCDEKD